MQESRGAQAFFGDDRTRMQPDNFDDHQLPGSREDAVYKSLRMSRSGTKRSELSIPSLAGASFFMCGGQSILHSGILASAWFGWGHVVMRPGR